MPRLIDADALIADLEYDVELDARALDCLDNEYRRDIIQFDKDCKQNAIDLLRKAPTVQLEPHWVLCSERLPEENGQYLITIKYKHVNDSYEDVYTEHGEWLDGKWDMFCFGHCGEVEDIIAWLSLPEPYKG